VALQVLQEMWTAAAVLEVGSHEIHWEWDKKGQQEEVQQFESVADAARVVSKLVEVFVHS